jgi:hypothetical protein
VNVVEDWKARIVLARETSERHSRTLVVRTPMAQVFRRLIQTTLEPAFNEVARFAREEGAACLVDIKLDSVQPRAGFIILPSGRSVRYELDGDGITVRELEGVHRRALAQHRTWSSVDDLHRHLTYNYARRAAATIVQDHFRAAAVETPKAG